MRAAIVEAKFPHRSSHFAIVFAATFVELVSPKKLRPNRFRRAWAKVDQEIDSVISDLSNCAKSERLCLMTQKTRLSPIDFHWAKLQTDNTYSHGTFPIKSTGKRPFPTWTELTTGRDDPSQAQWNYNILRAAENQGIQDIYKYAFAGAVDQGYNNSSTIVATVLGETNSLDLKEMMESCYEDLSFTKTYSYLSQSLIFLWLRKKQQAEQHLEELEKYTRSLIPENELTNLSSIADQVVQNKNFQPFIDTLSSLSHEAKDKCHAQLLKADRALSRELLLWEKSLMPGKKFSGQSLDDAWQSLNRRIEEEVGKLTRLDVSLAGVNEVPLYQRQAAVLLSHLARVSMERYVDAWKGWNITETQGLEGINTLVKLLFSEKKGAAVMKTFSKILRCTIVWYDSPHTVRIFTHSDGDYVTIIKWFSDDTAPTAIALTSLDEDQDWHEGRTARYYRETLNLIMPRE